MNDHKEAMIETGFWGRAAAGALVVSEQTGRFLIALRAKGTLQPGTWGTWGGAIDAGETALDAVIRELHEETEYTSNPIDVLPLYVFQHETGFKYSNFLVVVDQEFEPILNWEMQQYGWFNFGDWPDPLHFGLSQLLRDSKSLATMRRYKNNSNKGLGAPVRI
jgi:8-oxo-dGTP pyrophosphatase MutT (NUDIX family)